MMPSTGRRSVGMLGGGRGLLAVVLLVAVLMLAGVAEASIGDRLPEFRECVEICMHENCDDSLDHKTPIPLIHRLLLWSCPHECDYTCQHIITDRRTSAGVDVVQFHGKWPFQRVLGMQEPLSVLFSAGNLWAHLSGLYKLRSRVPATYALRTYYQGFALSGLAAWTASVVFHTRDFRATEQVDYFAAGANVLYGCYLAVVRIHRLDTPARARAARAWTLLCLSAYAAHVAYLKLVRWSYTYNMAANVAVGAVQNVLWSRFSWTRYRRERRAWTALPGLAVAWITMAMGLELFDFPPLWGHIDAHSLWHLGTIFPTVLWYNFLIKDAEDDIAGVERLKA